MHELGLTRLLKYVGDFISWNYFASNQVLWSFFVVELIVYDTKCKHVY